MLQCAQYVAPKSLTLNLAQMLAGDGVKKDTNALGVLVITIHHAVGLSAQDENGSSDPYIGAHIHTLPGKTTIDRDSFM